MWTLKCTRNGLPDANICTWIELAGDVYSKSVHTTSTSATAAIHNSAHCMCLAILSDTYGHAGTTTNVWIKHAADMQSLNVYHASYCSSMLTTSNWASLGEPHTSGKARLPVVEYYEFGPRSESGIPSIRLPSWRQSPRERPTIGLRYHFEHFSNSFGRFYGRKAPKRPPARPSSTGCRLSLEQGRSSNTALFSPQVSTKIWVGGENSRVSN